MAEHHRVSVATLLLAALPLLVACEIEVIEGNGRCQTANRQLSRFTEVITGSVMEIDVVLAERPEIDITCDSNLIEHIGTRIVDDALQIGVIDDMPERAVLLQPSGLCRATVKATTLRSATNVGPSRMRLKDSFARLESLTGMGEGRIEAQGIEVDSLAVAVRGPGDIQLQGRTATLDVESEGSGSLQARNLISEVADLHMLGSGPAELTVTDCVSITLLGSGNVTVAGDPEVCAMEDLGSGEVVFE